MIIYFICIYENIFCGDVTVDTAYHSFTNPTPLQHQRFYRFNCIEVPCHPITTITQFVAREMG